MPATKLGFVTQPNTTKPGCTITGGSQAAGLSSIVNAGIQVAVLDANGVVQTSDTSAVTIALNNTTNQPAPVQTAPSTSTSGGTGLAATTQYFYVVTAIGPLGESLKSNEQNVTTGAGGTNSNTINWNAATNATGYRIYRGTATGAENVYYTVGNVVTFLDTGAAGTSGTPPTGFTSLSGTLTQNAVRGVAVFSDLAGSIPASAYTLVASDGALTGATSNQFTINSVARVNPSEQVTTALVSTGVANAQGPYRFRGGSSLKGIEISGTSSNATDAVQIVVTEPGVAASTNAGEKLTTISNAILQVGPLTCPFHLMLGPDEIGGACDVYAYATTNTGSIIVNIKRVESGGRP